MSYDEAEEHLVINVVKAKVSEVFSRFWENMSVDPVTQIQVRKARDAAIHQMKPLRERLDAAMANEIGWPGMLSYDVSDDQRPTIYNIGSEGTTTDEGAPLITRALLSTHRLYRR